VKLPDTRFGSLEVRDEDILFFPIGILGFPEVHRYVMLDHSADTPLKWLQAVEKPELAFPIVQAAELLPDYRITVSSDDLATIGLETSADFVTCVILTIPNGAPERTTANLKAPILINPKTRFARQVLTAEQHPVQYRLSEEEPASVECAG